MARQRTTGPAGRRSGAATSGRPPLRRRTDSTLLLGVARPLTLAAAASAIAGVALALVGPEALAPVAFTLSSVVAIGLLAGARRADTAARHDHQPDQSPRTKRLMAAVVILAAIGTGASAWTIAADLAR